MDGDFFGTRFAYRHIATFAAPPRSAAIGGMRTSKVSSKTLLLYVPWHGHLHAERRAAFGSIGLMAVHS
jgi:hypothetical protein